MLEYRERELRDVMQGAALLGSGGGGPLAMGERMIEAIGDAPVRVVSPKEVDPNGCVVVVCDVGGSQQGSERQPEATWHAFERLRSALPEPVTAVVPIEIGPENSLAPMWVATQADVPVVDGDGAGRAVPRLGMTSFAEAELPISPVSLAADDGTCVLFRSVSSAELMEDLMRPLLTLPPARAPFANSAGLALWPFPAAQTADLVVAGGLERARRIGEALRERRADDPMEALRSILGDDVRELCRGRLMVPDHGAEGFDWDEIRVYLGDTGPVVRAFSINELLIAWHGDRPAPLATAPDLLCLVTADGEAFTLAEARDKDGEEVLLVGVRAHPAMHGDHVAALFRDALLALGYPGPFVPVCDGS